MCDGASGGIGIICADGLKGDLLDEIISEKYPNIRLQGCTPTYNATY